MFGFWVNSWLLGRFFIYFWPLVRFLDCGTISGFFGTIFGFLDNFLIWFDFWLLDQYLASWSILGYWVYIWSISGLWFDFCLWDDFWLFGRFLSFGLISGFWFNVRILGELFAIGSIFLSISGLWFDFWIVG